MNAQGTQNCVHNKETSYKANLTKYKFYVNVKLGPYS